MDFKEFISKVHPDPDSLLNDKFEQMCLLAEQYKDTINLQLQQTGVSGSVLKENKCNYAMPDCKHCALANCIYLNDGGL